MSHSKLALKNLLSYAIGKILTNFFFVKKKVPVMMGFPGK